MNEESADVKVDFIREFIRFPHLAEVVFNYLRPVDLRSVYCVCRVWKDMVTQSAKANKRRIRSIFKLKIYRKMVGRENWPISLRNSRLKRKLQNDTSRSTFGSIENRQTLNNNDNSATANNTKRKRSTSDNEEQMKNDKHKQWVIARVPYKNW